MLKLNTMSLFQRYEGSQWHLDCKLPHRSAFANINNYKCQRCHEKETRYFT